MALISNEEINNIRATANIVDIIGGYLPLTQKGKNYASVCPFHDDHSPSMSISEEKQIYKCFACGATGNVFTFVSEYENVPFSEAVAIVAEKCGIEVSVDRYKSSPTSNVHKEDYEIMSLAQTFFKNNLKTAQGEFALKYLIDRGIDEEVIKEFGIGLSLDNNDSLLKLMNKKNYDNKKLVELNLINNTDDRFYDMFTKRITFPLWDKDGNIVGFSGRIYRGEKDVSKYMNSKETPIYKKGETLYNYHNAANVAKREKEIIVVEGFMDAIRVASNGIKNVVALCGTAMTKDQITLLKKLRCKVILCLDNDNAGEMATYQNGEELIKNDVETMVIRLSGQKDPDEYIIANGVEAFKDNIKKPLSFFDFKLNFLKNGKNLSDSKDLSEYINLVLTNLCNEKDEILKEITLNNISEEYKISYSVLKDKLDKLTNKEEIKKIEIISQKEEEPPKRRDAYQISIEKILYFMMNGPEYINYYQKKLGFFSEAIYREIANEIVYFCESTGAITVADFITYINDKENIKSTVMKIVNDSVNDEVTLETMDEYINAVLKITTKLEIKRLMKQLKEELDVDKKMKIASQIQELKKGSVIDD